jgi:hypothetical protein
LRKIDTERHGATAPRDGGRTKGFTQALLRRVDYAAVAEKMPAVFFP